MSFRGLRLKSVFTNRSGDSIPSDRLVTFLRNPCSLNRPSHAVTMVQRRPTASSSPSRCTNDSDKTTNLKECGHRRWGLFEKWSRWRYATGCTPILSSPRRCRPPRFAAGERGPGCRRAITTKDNASFSYTVSARGKPLNGPTLSPKRAEESQGYLASSKTLIPRRSSHADLRGIHRISKASAAMSRSHSVVAVCLVRRAGVNPMFRTRASRSPWSKMRAAQEIAGRWRHSL